jgi:hypothetical protein
MTNPFLERTTSEIQAAVASLRWQPMDTAPTDRWLLGWNGIRPIIAAWVEPFLEGEGAWATDQMRRCDPPLTHWTELPEPPA